MLRTRQAYFGIQKIVYIKSILDKMKLQIYKILFTSH